ncbi:phosphatase PAP2 family protein [Streptomyces sp. H10-C2]|uniref:phosphatase PAP2 family protein n=1 Tax=unclassified Streptomyces TaxID=2593676 RepID=UPI0024B99C12|nr:MULTISPECIES: phosphatase PAP2 family protein [unclassified Streptomyces]MDJ0345845.1 phosphatase PAP2 family protein [Streptomyces sp. PH10-H1]MDJ0371189.1 phosphatase PAP2 family protein [Streptomyces sp. H10-C2]
MAAGLTLRMHRPPFFQGLDERWMAWMNGGSGGAATGLADALDRLGGPMGLIFPIALIGCLCVYGRWRSGIFVFVSTVLANVVVVLPLKRLVDRPRPPHPWVLVNDGSFPSGQVFGATTLVIVIAVVAFPLRARRWWWPAGGVYIAAMMWSRTWLHAQWFSDTVAGVLAGAGTCLLVWLAFEPLLRAEAVRAVADRLWE